MCRPDSNQMGPKRRGGGEGKARLGTQLCAQAQVGIEPQVQTVFLEVLDVPKVCKPYKCPADIETLANGDTGTHWLVHAIRVANHMQV